MIDLQRYGNGGTVYRHSGNVLLLGTIFPYIIMPLAPSGANIKTPSPLASPSLTEEAGHGH